MQQMYSLFQEFALSQKQSKLHFFMYVIRGTNLMELGDQETFPYYHYIIMFGNIGFVIYVKI